MDQRQPALVASDPRGPRELGQDMHDMPGVQVLDVFAGAGGLSLGLEAAGFKIAGGIEIDPDACETFAKAHPGAEVVCDDIGFVPFESWRDKVHIVAGGPPCQPWSTGGKRLGTADPRDGWPAFLAALREIRPAAFIAENVAGLATGVRKPYFIELTKELKGLGFEVTAKVLNAADFGVPQRRLRMFIVGMATRAFEFPEPCFGHGTGSPWRSAGEFIGPDPIGLPNPSIITFARNPDLRPNAYDGHIYNGGGRPIDLSKPAPTLLASMGGNKTPWVDVEGVVPRYHAHLASGGAPRIGRVPGARRITVEEAALLQTFRAGMHFVGRRSSCYRQIGNAVPPLLAQTVGAELLRQMTIKCPPSHTCTSAAVPAEASAAVRVLVSTRRFPYSSACACRSAANTNCSQSLADRPGQPSR